MRISSFESQPQDQTEENNMPGTKHISCVILARKEVNDIPNRNMIRIGGRTLVQIAVENALSSQIFKEVYVSTDDQSIAIEAENCGALVHYRDPSTTGECVPSSFALQEFSLKHPEVGIIGQIQCTCPFLKGDYLKEAYRKMIDEDLDCVFSVVRSKKRRYGQEGEPLNFNSYDKNEWEGDLLETGMFYFATKTLLSEGLLQGGKIGYVEVSETDHLDIKTRMDIMVAETLMRQRQIDATCIQDI